MTDVLSKISNIHLVTIWSDQNKIAIESDSYVEKDKWDGPLFSTATSILKSKLKMDFACSEWNSKSLPNWKQNNVNALMHCNHHVNGLIKNSYKSCALGDLSWYVWDDMQGVSNGIQCHST